MNQKFYPNTEYVYNGNNIGTFSHYRPTKEQQTYIWNGYAYFSKCIVYYRNYEFVEKVRINES
jgi:hypothetical protein